MLGLSIEGDGNGAAVGGLIRGIGPTLVIAAGSITPTHRSHAVDTEAGAGTDDLDTVVPTNALPGDPLVIRQLNAARAVTVRNLIGNITTLTGGNFGLVNTTRRGELTWDGTTWTFERFTG